MHLASLWPWPLTSDLEKLFGNSHSHGYYLCQVSLKSCETGVIEQWTDTTWTTGWITRKHHTLQHTIVGWGKSLCTITQTKRMCLQWTPKVHKLFSKCNKAASRFQPQDWQEQTTCHRCHPDEFCSTLQHVWTGRRECLASDIKHWLAFIWKIQSVVPGNAVSWTWIKWLHLITRQLEPYSNAIIGYDQQRHMHSLCFERSLRSYFIWFEYL